jgi:hypothetical protein
MTTAEIAGIFDARRVGAGKWMARCLGHPDLDPSLSIHEGRDGRTVLHCFAGCSVESVLQAAGLRMADLFPGPPPTAQQARVLAGERLRRDDEAQALRLERRRLTDRYRKLTAVVETIGKKLAHLPDDAPTGDAMTKLFDLALDRQRATEAELEATR